MAAAPNNSYDFTSGGISLTNPTPLSVGTSGTQSFNVQTNVSAEFILETTQIFYANNGANTTALFCLGWTENI
jgi:hypothetical protein